MRRSCCAGCGTFPGLADARIQQSLNGPGFNVEVDRTRAQYAGVTARDVTNSMVVNLAGSSQVAPTYFLNPENGVSYSIVMQTPQYQMESLNALEEPADLGARRHAADARRDRRRSIARRARGRLAVQHPGHGADLRDHAGPRSRRGRGRRAEGRERDAGTVCRTARRSTCSARCAR